MFAENPDTLFIVVTAPPVHYAGDPTDTMYDTDTDTDTDTETATSTENEMAHRARLFNDWLKGEWLDSYNTRYPTHRNVAIFDWFDLLAYPDNHPTYSNRLKAEYGGESGSSYPNSVALQHSTEVFATDYDNFLDAAWFDFISSGHGAVEIIQRFFQHRHYQIRYRCQSVQFYIIAALLPE